MKSLKKQFIFITALVCLTVSVFTIIAFKIAVDRLVLDFGVKFAVNQASLLKNKLLSVIERDLVLSQKMANSEILKKWAWDENNPDIKPMAMKELDGFRILFRDKSYFVGLAKSNAYYFNDAQEKYTGKEFIKYLREDDKADGWFFSTLEKVDTFDINIDYDMALDVTKVWINTVLKDGDEKLGVVGSGIDLSEFIRSIVSSKETSVTNTFLGKNGEIKAHPDSSRIDFNSVTKSGDKWLTIFGLMNSETEIGELRGIMAELAKGSNDVKTLFVTMDGRQYLAAVSYIPQIEWYDVVFVDVWKVMGIDKFIPMGGIMVFSLLLILGAIVWALQTRVLRPLSALTESAKMIADGKYDIAMPVSRNDEIGVLTSTFNSMAATVLDYTLTLENKVKDRTEQIHQANLDLRDQITRREEVETNLRMSEGRFKTLADATFEGIVISEDGRIIDANRLMESISGWPHEELLTMSVYDFVAPESMEKMAASVEMKFEKPVEILIKRKDGRSFPVEVQGKFTTYKDRTALVIAIKDISERKKMEAEIIRARDMAEQANQAKSQFLANMSHEIRTPMNAIIGMSHLALRTGLTPKQKDYLNKIYSSAQLLLGIINDILDFSKVEAGKMSLEKIDFDLESVLGYLSNLFSPKSEEKGLEFLISCPQNVPRALVGDPLRLGQILTNLVGNAIKFTEKGEIVVTVEVTRKTPENVTLRFSARDTGIGMSQEEIRELFRPFSQADISTTRRFGGTGLGLAISKRLVEMMDGEIQLESEPGKGSVFYFTAVFGLSKDKKKITNMSDIKVRGQRVLVVDDNSTSREILCELLESLSMRPTAVESGQAAIETMNLANDAGKPFDLVLMDWQMPGMDGVETSRRLRSDPNLPKPPTIIMVTAYGREEVMSRVGESELDGILLKPVSASLLLDVIMSALGGKAVFDRPENIPDAISGTRMASIRAGSRVLLAEDNHINQQVAQELLEGAELNVTIACNGLEALEALRNESFDLVLMDIQMPEMDGFEATRAIKTDDKLRNVPVIAMTAHAMAGDREKCLAAGIDDYLTKPIDPEQLYATLSKWLPATGEQTRTETRRTEPTETPEEHFPETLAGIDMKTGLSKILNNARLFRKLLIEFRKDHADDDTIIEKALAEGNMDKAQRVVHAVKGVGGNLGATKLYEAAQILDTALKNDANTDKPFADFRVAFTEVMNGLSTLSEAPTAPQPIELAFDPATLEKLFADLSQRLAEYSPRASDTLPEIRKALGNRHADLLTTLEEQVDGFRFEEAGKTLDNIRNSIKNG